MKSSIYLPRFPWFYASILSDMIDRAELTYLEYAIENNILPPESTTEDLEKIREIDYDRTRTDIALQFYQAIQREIENWLFLATSMKFLSFQGIISPRQYNFWTDELEIEIEYDHEKITDFLIKHRPAFSQYILDKNTSYDGFMAYFPNDFDEYVGNELEPWQLTQVIDFYIETLDDDDIIDRIIESIEPSLFFTEKQ